MSVLLSLNLQAEAYLIVTKLAPVVEGRHGVQVPDLGPCLLSWPPLLPRLQALDVLLHSRGSFVWRRITSTMPGSVSWHGPGHVRAL